jgi:hypothetical protein
MDLAELVALRPVPCAGLLLTVTQRCPLRCAHCSSASTMHGSDRDHGSLRRFIGSFTPDDRPDVLMITGGEPLLLPDLVAELAASARAAGTRSAVLTGAFFARDRRMPDRILRAARAVDHFSVSIDVHHEREVPRADVFRLLRTVLRAGTPVSLHLVGTGPVDPYLAGLTADVRSTFGDAVPMLVNTVRAVGRAAAWAAATRPADTTGAVLPCAMAAWPVVAPDGTVVACCNQDTVDRRPVPAHLRLGHVDTDDWPTVRGRALSSPVLRAVRITGPTYLLARAGAGLGYCQGCRRLGDHREAMATAAVIGSGALGELLDRQTAQTQVDAGPVAFLRRHACAPYADLVMLPDGSR